MNGTEELKNNRNMSLFAVIAFGLVAYLLYGVGAAIRNNIGMLLNPLAGHSGAAYDQVSLCIAMMNFMFGASQPVWGVIASKMSNRRVLGIGLCMLTADLVGIMATHSIWTLFFFLGIVFGFGAGAVAFGMILTSCIHFVGQEHAMTISGMLNAAAGMVSFVLAPVMQSLLDRAGLAVTLTVLCVLCAALIPVSIFVTSRDPKSDDRGDVEKSGPDLSLPVQMNGIGLIKHAFANRTYRLLLAGFSTCGFHMVIIESHLYNQYISYGIPGRAASWAFSFYGVATITGALLSGWLSSRVHEGHLLGFYYGFRVVWTLFYLFLLPKNILTAFIFSIGLGMTGDATISPTSGLVNRDFQLHEVATLIGFLFLGHQTGAFLSAWLGGILFKATGGYTVIWMIDVALCTFASVMSMRIRKE